MVKSSSKRTPVETSDPAPVAPRTAPRTGPVSWVPVALISSAVIAAVFAYALTLCSSCPSPVVAGPPLLALKHLQQLPTYSSSSPSSSSSSSSSPADASARPDPVAEPLRSAVLAAWPQEASQWREPVLGVRAATEPLPFGRTFAFAMVADLDARSRHPHQLQWHSYVTLGELTLPPLEPTDAAAAHSAAAADTTAAAAAAAAAAGVGASVGVTWGATTEMTTSLAANNRSIELSDMVWFQGKFLTVCDYTGVVYKFRPQTGEIFPRFILADGDGKVARAFKSEWMTVYGPHLLVGSHGKEWVSGGKVIARGAEWVKVIQEGGKVSSVDWQHVYHRIRRAANATSPGYLSHEAVLWHEPARKWVFLPRKASHEQPFDDEADEQMGTNLLILVSEDLESSVEVLRVGPLEPEWGFASLARVPGSDLMLATKVREVGSETQTKLALFDLRGRMLFPGDGFVSVDADRKYEGIEFLGQFESI